MSRRDGIFDARRRAIEREGSPQAAEAMRYVMGGMTSGFADPAMADFVARVARRPRTLTDEHFAALRAAGHDEERLFDLVCAAATAEGLRRRDRALRALRGDRP